MFWIHAENVKQNFASLIKQQGSNQSGANVMKGEIDKEGEIKSGKMFITIFSLKPVALMYNHSLYLRQYFVQVKNLLIGFGKPFLFKV